MKIFVLIDEDIANGVNVLKRSDILYIIGQLGNSVSTLGKDIAKKYKEDFKMEIEELHYLDLSANLKDNTVYFVDGWCGLWNDNLCERDLVKENHNLILQYCENNKKVRLSLSLDSGLTLKICSNLFCFLVLRQFDEIPIQHEKNKALLDIWKYYKEIAKIPNVNVRH